MGKQTDAKINIRLGINSVLFVAVGYPLVTNSDDPTTGQISAPTWDGTLRRIRVPIPMYHYVRPYSPNDDPIKRSLAIEPDVFLTHLDYLKKQKYSTISLYDLDRALLDGTDLPGKAIILTFDDGYIDQSKRWLLQG